MNDPSYPLFSVVIPTYNHANYLHRSLRSVLDQTYQNFEIIVIDNHSIDNTDEIVANFSDERITYLKIHNHGVIAASRNQGIKAAKGEWIAFLDSDDWWSVNKLEMSVNYINPGVDFLYHNLKIVGEKFGIVKRGMTKSWELRSPVLIDLLLNGNPIVNSSVVVRKRLLCQIGAISEEPEMIATEDYNTWMRIAQISEKFVRIPFTLGSYLLHSQNVSNRNMAKPMISAVNQFTHLLNQKQKLKLEANIKYTSASYHHLNCNYVAAVKEFG